MSQDNDREIEQRVKVLTRLRQLLVAQREKFRSYLDALELEGDAIRRGDVDRFEAHVQLEQSIVKDIIHFRNAVNPLEEVYRTFASSASGADTDIPELREHLDRLETQILRRNEENRGQLRLRLEELKRQVAQLRVPFQRASVYSGSGSAGMVDITT